MIQIDMPMPTNCLDCPACNEYLTCAIPVNGRKWGENDVREFGQGRPDWCPLKEQDTKTGYWITEEPNTYTRRTYCSVCSKSAPFIYVSDDYYGGRSHGETKNTKYCPNCGAKMET